MAFCTSCGTEVIQGARFCSGCGRPRQGPPLVTAPKRNCQRSFGRAVMWVAVSIVGSSALLVVIALIIGSSDDFGSNSPGTLATPAATPTPTLTFARSMQEAEKISYDDLFRNNEQHVGKTVYYRAQIVQVINAGKDEYQFRANVTEGTFGWDDTVYLHCEGSRLLEDDVIEFIGVVDGLKEYRAVFDQEITIPEIRTIRLRLFDQLLPSTASDDVAIEETQ